MLNKRAGGDSFEIEKIFKEVFKDVSQNNPSKRFYKNKTIA